MNDEEYLDGESLVKNEALKKMAELCESSFGGWAAMEALNNCNLHEKVDLNIVNTNYGGNLWVDGITGAQEPARERFGELHGNLTKFRWKIEEENKREQRIAKLMEEVNMNFDVWKNYVFDSEWEKGRKYYDEVFKAKPRKLLHEKIKIKESHKSYIMPRMNFQHNEIRWENVIAEHGLVRGNVEVRVVDGQVIRENIAG